MRFFSHGVRITILALVFVIGITVGTIGISTTIANTDLDNSSSQDLGFPKNENGVTYGSALEATSLDTEPDLILAYGVDGTLGYVRSIDLNDDIPKTPEEAIVIQKQNMDAGPVRQIPLYDVDGKTVIGKFNITNVSGHEIKE